METMRGLKRFVEDIEYQIKAKEREIEDLEDKKLTIIKNADFTSTSNRLAFIKNIDDIDIKIIDAKDAISRLQAFSKEYF